MMQKITSILITNCFYSKINRTVVEFSMKTLAKYTKITDPKLLEESYRFAVDVFEKDGRIPPESQPALVEQLVALKLIDPDAAKNTPTTAYYDNRYVDELEKEGFFKGLWQH